MNNQDEFPKDLGTRGRIAPKGMFRVIGIESSTVGTAPDKVIGDFETIERAKKAIKEKEEHRRDYYYIYDDKGNEVNY